MSPIPLKNINPLQCLSQHTSDITSCDFAPDFTLVTGSSDKTVRLWDWTPGFGYQEKTYSPLKGHKYGVTCVKVSPHGTMLATSSIDGTLVLWNMHTGEKIFTFVQINGDAIRICRFSPDGTILVTGGDNGAICVWDLIHRCLVRAIFEHDGTTQSLAFTPDSELLVSACTLEVVRVWNMRDILDTTEDLCQPISTIDNAHDLGIVGIDISNMMETDDLYPLQRSYTLATAGNTDMIKIWTILSTKAPKSKEFTNNVSLKERFNLIGHKSAVTCVRYNNHGNLLVSSSMDKTVKIWDNNGGCLSTLSGHNRYVNCVAFSRDSSLVASGSNDKSFCVWDLTDNIGLDSELARPQIRIELSFSKSQEVQLLQQVAESESCSLIEKIDDISEAAVNTCCISCNKIVATGSSDKLIRLFQLEENNNIEELGCSPLENHTYSVNYLEFSKDGKLLASCSLDGRTLIWNPLTGEKISEIESNYLGVRICRFSFDGQLLITGGDDEKANIWDVTTGDSVGILEGHSDAVTGACFSPDSEIIATASHNGDFRLWSRTLANIFVQDVAHDLGIQSCDFSENLEPIPTQTVQEIQNYLLATCGNDSLVKLWRISIPKNKTKFLKMEVKQWRLLQGHGGHVIFVRFSPVTGEIVGSTATDRQVRIWSVYSGMCLHVLDHDSIVTCCSFSSDCSLLVSGSLDKTVWLWKLPEALAFQSNIAIKIMDSRKKGVINWNGDDVSKWLKEIGLGTLTEKILKVRLNGEKIMTISEEDICESLDLETDEFQLLSTELKWLKMDEIRMNTSSFLTMDDIPDEFFCPITHEIMKEPVICSDGFTYEKQAINEWFLSGKDTSPMTNQKLENTDYLINQELRNAIHKFVYNNER